MSESAKKIYKFDPKKAVCKEFDCPQTATTKGYCRLHYIKKLKGSSPEAQLEHLALKKMADRRQSNRLQSPGAAPTSDASPFSPETIVGTIENLDGDLDLNLEEQELPSTDLPEALDFSTSRSKSTTRKAS